MDGGNLHLAGRRVGLALRAIPWLTILSLAWFSGASTTWGQDLPAALIPRTTRSLTIDGKLDDAAWQAAPTYYLTRRGAVSPGQFASARLIWDHEHLYAGFDVVDGDLRATFTGRDDPLWEDGDCVELFLHRSDTEARYEIQINPLGALLDAAHQVKLRHPFDHTMQHLRWAVQVEGTLNDAKESDQGWSAEVAIPWSAIGGREPTVTWKVLLACVNRQGLRPELVTRELSCWPPLTSESFGQPASYAVARFVEDKTDVVEGVAQVLVGRIGRRDHLMTDFRGPALTWEPDPLAGNTVAWLTAQVPDNLQGPVEVAFIGQSTGPAEGSPTLAELWVNGRMALQFAPHPNRNQTWTGDHATLTYTYRGGEGISSGLYRLRYLPEREASQALRLEVRVAPDSDVAWLLKCHTDARQFDLH